MKAAALGKNVARTAGLEQRMSGTLCLAGMPKHGSGTRCLRNASWGTLSHKNAGRRHMMRGV